jgi:serine/threonine protein kinase
MEERYEIRGKIGQGGLGAVYRGYDTRMNREVAIKRISTTPGDPDLQEESTRQLMKEAGTLASLQHPNIVTVYDVGLDEDGPYVVMELINGNTLDELIEKAPLVWQDFRELAMQTQEALIAAQERNIIHGDIKPANLMFTWLPSGKFQVKIVDFGLAMLARTQTKEDLETLEAVFGSIFFMPPEQFERQPLDERSDLYSMGCVYYQALTGLHPFGGESGNEVMESHLIHKVRPIQEVRSEIPLWACEWIMWHLNRMPHDRPESARDALSVFLKNDRIPNPAMSTGVPKGPPRARLIIPGADPATQAAVKAKLAHTSQVPLAGNEKGVLTQTAPQPLAPPEGFKPSVHTSQHDLPETRPTQPAPHHPARPLPAPPRKQGFKLSKNGKIGLAVAAAVLLAVLGMFLMKVAKEKREAGAVATLLEQASKPGATNVDITAATLRLILKATAKTESDTDLQKIGKALSIAKATDGTDVDERIAVFAVKGPEISDRAREILISEVLRNRNNPTIKPVMLEFIASSSNPKLVVAALQSIRQSSGDNEFETFLNIIKTTNDNLIREAAVINIEEILLRSSNVANLTKQLESASATTIKPDIQIALKQLIRFAGSVKPANK